MLGYSIMPLLARLGYTTARVEQSRHFLCRHDAFLVLDSPDARWFDRLVGRDRAFVGTELGATTPTRYPAGASTVRYVRRVPGRTPAPCRAASAP
jgi:hypothetical protein